ncbi:MAG TPA: hypothetical protein VNI55_09430 [Gaiellaceae bacterium]|nr:hypothetical protein [Gaiellaceae bacterium]
MAPLEVAGRSAVLVPMTGSTWEQRAGELNLVYASVEVQAGPVCWDFGAPDVIGVFFIELILDGATVARAQASPELNARETVTLSAHLNSDLVASRAVEVRVFNTCERVEDVGTVTRSSFDVAAIG